MAEPQERVDLDEGGRVRQRYHVVGDVPHGAFTVWDAEGWIAQKGSFAEGVLEGELVQYDSHGRVEAVLHYRKGKLEGEALFFNRGLLQIRTEYRNGMQDGETIVYDANEQPSAKSLYFAGQLHGLSAWYRPDGSLLRTVEYVEGLEVEAIDYDERGRAVQRVRAATTARK